MGRTRHAIVQLNPSYLAFFSGVLVSAGVNILTMLAAEGFQRSRGAQLCWVSFLLLASAVVLMILSWNLELPFSEWRRWALGEYDAADLSPNEAIERISGGQIAVFWRLLGVGLLLFLGALVILVI